MTTRVPAKSILRQQSSPNQPTISDEDKAKADRDRRNLGIALYHANKIQAQKDAEAAILKVIEELLEYPAGMQYAPSEAASFRTLIVPFQPSDFDSLVEERRIDVKCGYPLCSNLPRSSTLGSNAAWKLKGKGAADYCSNDCLQKALYVKAQLSEVPAWERQPGEEPEIALPLDDRSANEVSMTAENLGAARQTLRERQGLALERGEQATSFRPSQVMLDNIVEKATAGPKVNTFTETTEVQHDAIEGYVPGHMAHNAVAVSVASKPHGPSSEVRSKSDQGHVNEEEESWNALYENMAAGQNTM